MTNAGLIRPVAPATSPPRRRLASLHVPLSGSQNVRYQYPSTRRTAEVRYGHTTLNDEFGLLTTQDNMSRTLERTWVGVDTSRVYVYDVLGRLDRYEDWIAVADTAQECDWDPDTGWSGCLDGVSVFSDSVHYGYDDVGNRTDHNATVTTGNRLEAFDGYALT